MANISYQQLRWAAEAAGIETTEPLYGANGAVLRDARRDLAPSEILDAAGSQAKSDPRAQAFLNAYFSSQFDR
jgi:hypothetical protein